jgi:hypothetical protein
VAPFVENPVSHRLIAADDVAMGIVLYIFWPAIAAFIAGGLLANGKRAFGSIFIVGLVGLATYQRLTSALTSNRSSAVAVTWAEVAVGALLGWAITRKLRKLPPG